MSISIYYTARRDHELSPDERTSVEQLIRKYAIKEHFDEQFRSGKGYNWESFFVYGRFHRGATKLPGDSEDALLHGLQH
jgi:hypothetical protein